MLEFYDSPMLDGVEAANADRGALQNVQEELSLVTVTPHASAHLTGSDGKQLEIPEPLFQILRTAASMLLRGERVTLAPVSKELSTQEAADLLNVSRPYLITLLDQDKIPYTKTGRNRRVCFGDVVNFRAKRDAERRTRLHAMIRKSEELGLYDYDEASIDLPR
jgi:excisionase family DNA binding protein